MFLTMLIAAISAFFERGPERIAGFLALPFFWASFTGIGMMNKSEAIGAWERLWLGASVGWLVVLAVAALLAQRRRGRLATRRTARRTLHTCRVHGRPASPPVNN